MMQHRFNMTRHWLAILAVALGAYVSRAHAATQVTLVGPDLKPERVQMQGLSDGVLTYFDSQRRYQSRKLAELVQVRQIGDEPKAQVKPATTSVVELVDGQRLLGRWAGGDADGETIVWQNELLGTMKLPLDRVRSITWSGSPIARRAGGSDVVILGNGDELSGFVVAVTSEHVQVRVDDQREPLTLPLERVRALQLSNAGQPDPNAHLIWLADGTRVRSTTLRVEESYMLFDANGPQRQPLSAVRRIDIANKAGQLVDLADLPFSVAGGEVFGVKQPPRVTPQGLWMHAPVRATFTLPEGAQRLAMVASVAKDGSGDARWADMELKLHVAGDVTTWHMAAESPDTAINMAVSGRQIAIELTEGLNGPVMDRLLLRDAVVLVK
jgi:hypothetical protein